MSFPDFNPYGPPPTGFPQQFGHQQPAPFQQRQQHRGGHRGGGGFRGNRRGYSSGGGYQRYDDQRDGGQKRSRTGPHHHSGHAPVQWFRASFVEDPWAALLGVQPHVLVPENPPAGLTMPSSVEAAPVNDNPDEIALDGDEARPQPPAALAAETLHPVTEADLRAQILQMQQFQLWQQQQMLHLQAQLQQQQQQKQQQQQMPASNPVPVYNAEEIDLDVDNIPPPPMASHMQPQLPQAPQQAANPVPIYNSEEIDLDLDNIPAPPAPAPAPAIAAQTLLPASSFQAARPALSLPPPKHS